MNIAEGSDMEMMDFLEADKEQLMSGLRSAGSPEKAQNVVEKEFDRLLLRYNEECEIERVRDTARYLLQAAKMMVPMLSAAGEARIWSSGSGSGSNKGASKMTWQTIACLAGGILFLAGAVIGLAVSAGSGLTLSSLFGAVPAAILAGVLLFWAGRLSLDKSAGPGQGTEEGQQVELRVNPERVWSCMRAVILSVDKSLLEAEEAVNYEKSQLPPSSGNGITPEEAELFSGIMENAYSSLGEDPGDTAAQETISVVRYYLHRKQVETVEFGGGKREWFELLPGKSDMTLRPAFVRDGVLIRKGLAVTAQ